MNWNEYLEQVANDLTKIIVQTEYDTEHMIANDSYYQLYRDMKENIFGATFKIHNSGLMTDEETFKRLIEVYEGYMACITS